MAKAFGDVREARRRHLGSRRVFPDLSAKLSYIDPGPSQPPIELILIKPVFPHEFIRLDSLLCVSLEGVPPPPRATLGLLHGDRIPDFFAKCVKSPCNMQIRCVYNDVSG